MDSSLKYTCIESEGTRRLSNNQEQHSFWNSAPDELIAKILALLPFSRIYICGGVCRRWRSIVWSPLFISLCKQWSRPRKPWLLEFQQQMYNQAWAFDLDGRQWFHLDLSFVPENAIILASSGGLICLGRMSTEGYTLYTCNPLTRIWRKLPPTFLDPGIVLLDVDHQSHTYKVVVLVLRGRACRPSGSVLVFDSKSGLWTETIGVPPELYCDNLWDASLCGGFLCCLSAHQRIEAFDIAKEEWKPRVAFTNPPRRAGDAERGPYILDLAGNLGAVVPHRSLKGKSIFQYDMSVRGWESVHPANAIVCAGRFSSLCFGAVQEGCEVYLLHAEGHKCYSSSSSSFSVLPKSPLTRRKIQGREILIRAVWFEPHLGVMA